MKKKNILSAEVRTFEMYDDERRQYYRVFFNKIFIMYKV